jgi:flagellar biosynthesis protein FlhG
MELVRRVKHVFAVAGGKGGVGKSVFAVNLSTVLADLGKRVVIVDLDLGGANLHTYLGVVGKTPSLARFITKDAKTLAEILTDTENENLKLISGAEYLPGMSSPAGWMKDKLMRHLKNLDCDIVVIDLGAGMDLSTLDFFTSADRGFLVTIPEPGAVMNAYRFVKGALFRKLHNVFRRHTEIGPILDKFCQNTAQDGAHMLQWFMDRVAEVDPDVYPVVREIGEGFRPYLVLNRTPAGETGRLVQTLLSHCREKYFVDLKYLGNLPDVRAVSDFLLNVPRFIRAPVGKEFYRALKDIVVRLLFDIADIEELDATIKLRRDFDDSRIRAISELIDTLDDALFVGTQKKLWKLRLFFKPAEVVRFLVGKGVREKMFFEEI